MVGRSAVLRLLFAVGLVAQMLIGPATPTSAQVPPRITGTARCNGIGLPNASVTTFSGSVQVDSRSAGADGSFTIPGTKANSTYTLRYLSVDGSTACGVSVTTNERGDATAPEPSPCPAQERANRTWLKAFELSITALGTVTLTDSLCKPRQSRWYKVPVLAGQRVTAEILDPPFDANLALFRDIRLTAQQLKPPAGGSLTLEDVRRITASLPKSMVAPDETSPDETSGDVRLQDVTAPDETSPDETSPDETSPDETSPDFATPDETSPDETSPDETSPDLYSVAQTHSIIAYSDKPGRAPELVRRHTWDNYPPDDRGRPTGFFYIRVHGHNGAFDETRPFSLKVTLENRRCVDPEGLRNTPMTLPPSFTGGVATPQTLILTNSSRFPVGSDTVGLLDSLNAFAARPEVGGAVFDLAGDANLQRLYAQWDDPAFVDCVPAANIVVEQIHKIEELIRAQSPTTLQSVVLAGTDHVIPFKRLPDQAGIGIENTYSPAVLDGSASQASLKGSYFLSQDVYGSFSRVARLDHDFDGFDVPVGRLGENVPEIQTQLTTYATTNGLIQPSSALVTGYDFLSPAADLQREDLAVALGAANVNAGDDPLHPLIGKLGDGPNAPTAWRDTELRNRLFGPERYGILALNAHFSGNTLLAADHKTRINSRDVANVTDDRFFNTLWLSMGCHSAYNIVDAEATPGTQRVDWAQAIAKNGGWLVGGTGYQYGNNPFVKYSEVLLSGLVHELRFYDDTPGPVSLGQAIVNTKRAYLHQGMTGIDEKAVAELTLYGLPNLRVNLPGGRIPRPVNPPPVETIPSRTSPGLASADLTPAYRLAEQHQTLNKVGGGTTVATYFDANVPSGDACVPTHPNDACVAIKPGQPVLPRVVSSVASTARLARSAVVLEADYTDLFNATVGGCTRDCPPFRPLVDQALTEARLVRPAYSASILAPAHIVDVNLFDGQFVSVTPFQFQSRDAVFGSGAHDSVFGMGRRYDRVKTRVYYSDRTDSSALAGPPTIYNTRVFEERRQLMVDVTVGGPLRSDGVPDIETVWATFTADQIDGTNPLYGHWFSVPLQADPSVIRNSVGFLRHYRGQIGAEGVDNRLIRLIVQAVGGNGLTSVATNNGTHYQLVRETATLGNPKISTSLKLQPEGGAPYSAQYRSTLTLSARLTNAGPGPAMGTPLERRPVTFSFGRARVRSITDASGLASATLPVLLAPGDFPSPRVTVGFEEDTSALASGDSRDVLISRDRTNFVRTSFDSIPYGAAANVATLFAQPGNLPLREIGVRITLGDMRVLDTTTDGFGRVLFDTLDFEGVQPGSYPTTLEFFGDYRYQPSSLTFTQTVVGSGNRSLALTGAGWAEAQHADELNLPGDWTVELWFKDESPRGFDHEYVYLLNKGDADVDPESPYFVVLGSKQLVVGQRTGWADFGVVYDLYANGVDPRKWHHVAATVQATTGNLMLYVDGSLVTQGVLAATSVGNTLPVEIGRNGPISGKYFRGKLDDVRLWNVARSAAQIAGSYTQEFAAPQRGLVANWQFNERIGTLLAFSTVGGRTAILSTSGAAFSPDVHP